MDLRVRLRDGFNNDTVTIRVNGQRVYSASGVTTDLTISFADAVEVAVEKPLVMLEVAVEGGQTETREVLANETPFVDVWVINGQMELKAAERETPML